MPPTDSVNTLPFPSAADAALSGKPSEIEREVIELFEQFRDPLLRYSLSFGIPVHDAEEVTQEVFLSLFRHLQLRRSRKNLRGGIFRIAHNLALKQLYANQRSHAKTTPTGRLRKSSLTRHQIPKNGCWRAQRRHRLRAVAQALAEGDQSCLRLRVEGLRYREIATVLGMSLGAVSISLTRSLARLIRADGR